jgi:hypothetical protein
MLCLGCQECQEATKFQAKGLRLIGRSSLIKISGQWRHLLEDEEDTAYPGQWLSVYVEGEEDPTFVLCCDLDFTHKCLQWHNLTLPLPVQCFTVGTHSRCLRVWEQHPLREMAGFFHKVKIIQFNRGPKKERENEVILLWQNGHPWLGSKLVAVN